MRQISHQSIAPWLRMALLTLENATFHTTSITKVMLAVPQGYFQGNPKPKSCQAASDAMHPHRSLSLSVCLQANIQHTSNHLVWSKWTISSCCLAICVSSRWKTIKGTTACLGRLESPSLSNPFLHLDQHQSGTS